MNSSQSNILDLVKEAGSPSVFPVEQKVIDILEAVADEAMVQSAYILAENAKDLQKIESDNPKYDALRLSLDRLKKMTAEVRTIASLVSPVGRVLQQIPLSNGFIRTQKSVPFGVLAWVYEARPDLAFSLFAASLKSGNACILKCGSEAFYTNRAMVNVVHSVLEWFDVTPYLLELYPSDRKSLVNLLNAVGYVNLLIPVGSRMLVDYVRTYASIPVIVTETGLCHLYFDRDGDLKTGIQLLQSAKMQNPKAPWAIDTLLVHEERLNDLADLLVDGKQNALLLYVDEPALSALQGNYPDAALKLASAKQYRTEFSAFKMAIKTVSYYSEALEHILKFGGGYAECIVTENRKTADIFSQTIDAACIYINASPAFTGGREFGYGIDMGVSTQKLHVRGPIGLSDLNSAKWVIEKNEQIKRQIKL